MRAMRDLLAGSVTVHEGEAPSDAAPPYVVLVGQRNADEQRRETGPHATEVVQVGTRCVGETLEQALWLDERVDGVLRPGGMGVRLEVDGRTCSRIERRSTDLEPDDSASRLWETLSSYRFTSTP